MKENKEKHFFLLFFNDENKYNADVRDSGEVLEFALGMQVHTSKSFNGMLAGSFVLK